MDESRGISSLLSLITLKKVWNQKQSIMHIAMMLCVVPLEILGYISWCLRLCIYVIRMFVFFYTVWMLLKSKSKLEHLSVFLLVGNYAVVSVVTLINPNHDFQALASLFATALPLFFFVDYIFSVSRQYGTFVMGTARKILCVLNFILIFIFPKGLVPWHTQIMYLFAYRNSNFAPYFVLSFLVLIEAYDRKQHLDLEAFLWMLLGLVNFYCVKSITALFLQTFLMLSSVLVFWKRPLLKPRIWMVYATIGIIALLLIFTVQKQVNWLFEFFSRDRSFTGRTQIWQQAIDAFVKKPILGYGIEKLEVLNQHFFNDHEALSTAHNYYLELLYEGGVVAFSLFTVLNVHIIRILSKQKQTSLVWVTNCVLFCLFLNFFVETYPRMQLLLVIFIIVERMFAPPDPELVKTVAPRPATQVENVS